MGPEQFFNPTILANYGAGALIAGILFFFYRKDVRSYTELWRQQAERSDKVSDGLMMIVRENSATIATNTEVLKSLHRRIDRLDILRVVTPEEEHELRQQGSDLVTGERKFERRPGQ
jgi:hypothetical protein